MEAIQEEITSIQKSIDSIPAEIIDIKEVEGSIASKEKKSTTLTADITNSQKDIVEKENLAKKIDTFINTFNVEELHSKKEIISEKLKLLEDINRQIQDAKKEAKNKNKKMQLLKEVPCGNQFPNCKFICDAHTASAEIPDLVSKVEALNESSTKYDLQIKELNPDQIDDHLQKYQEVVDKKENIFREISTMRLMIEKNEVTLKSLEKDIESLNEQKKIYYENKEVIENKESFIKELTEKEFLYLEKQRDLKECQDKILEYYKEHGSLEQKLKSLQDQKDELHNLREDFSAYDLFMRCMHTNGISYDIIKKKLPVINNEIAKVIANVVDFEVFFESDGKHLKVLIKHPKHEPRPIEMGSGAEKTIAAMAIRLALLSVSSLPKSNVFILDEPGAALDADNMDGFVRILDLVKSYFKTVLLISHLDSLKDCVDLQITIDKKDGYAFVENN